MFIIIALKINGWIMLFNSYEFIFLFLPITFFVYFFLNKKRLSEAAKGFLVLSSLFFLQLVEHRVSAANSRLDDI